MQLEGKKALVTGAGRGIGRTIVEHFLQEGAEVWGLDVTSQQYGENNSKLHWITTDLSKLDTIEPCIEQALKDSAGFDILVNNAGITKDALSFRMSLADFQKVLDINLTAAFLIARTVGREMIRKRSGSIINMASVVGLHGNAGQANYAASKGGLIGVTKSLAQEVASRGVRVNAIAPGYIATNMTDALPQEAKEKLMSLIALKRLGTPDDIANVAVFLASDASSYITGQVIQVDGGMFM
jgi:3-oxoacyl-[acyl-carrier protein] reductase